MKDANELQLGVLKSRTLERELQILESDRKIAEERNKQLVEKAQSSVSSFKNLINSSSFRNSKERLKQAKIRFGEMLAASYPEWTEAVMDPVVYRHNFYYKHLEELRQKQQKDEDDFHRRKKNYIETARKRNEYLAELVRPTQAKDKEVGVERERSLSMLRGEVEAVNSELHELKSDATQMGRDRDVRLGNMQVLNDLFNSTGSQLSDILSRPGTQEKLIQLLTDQDSRARKSSPESGQLLKRQSSRDRSIPEVDDKLEEMIPEPKLASLDDSLGRNKRVPAAAAAVKASESPFYFEKMLHSKRPSEDTDVPREVEEVKAKGYSETSAPAHVVPLTTENLAHYQKVMGAISKQTQERPSSARGPKPQVAEQAKDLKLVDSGLAQSEAASEKRPTVSQPMAEAVQKKIWTQPDNRNPQKLDEPKPVAKEQDTWRTEESKKPVPAQPVQDQRRPKPENLRYDYDDDFDQRPGTPDLNPNRQPEATTKVQTPDPEIYKASLNSGIEIIAAKSGATPARPGSPDKALKREPDSNLLKFPTFGSKASVGTEGLGSESNRSGASPAFVIKKLGTPDQPAKKPNLAPVEIVAPKSGFNPSNQGAVIDLGNTDSFENQEFLSDDLPSPPKEGISPVASLNSTANIIKSLAPPGSPPRSEVSRSSANSSRIVENPPIMCKSAKLLKLDKWDRTQVVNDCFSRLKTIVPTGQNIMSGKRLEITEERVALITSDFLKTIDLQGLHPQELLTMIVYMGFAHDKYFAAPDLVHKKNFTEAEMTARMDEDMREIYDSIKTVFVRLVETGLLSTDDAAKMFTGMLLNYQTSRRQFQRVQAFVTDVFQKRAASASQGVRPPLQVKDLMGPEPLSMKALRKQKSAVDYTNFSELEEDEF